MTVKTLILRLEGSAVAKKGAAVKFNPKKETHTMTDSELKNLAAQFTSAVLHKGAPVKTSAPVLTSKRPEVARPGGGSFKWSGESLGAVLKAVHGLQGAVPDAARVASRLKDPVLAKAVQESVFDSAGVLVPVTSYDRVIEVLRPRVLGAINPRRLPIDSDLQVPVESTSTKTQWMIEGQQASEISGGSKWRRIILKAYKLQVWLPCSNDLLRREDGNDVIGNAVLAAVGDALDDAAINGTGILGQPLGLLAQAGTTLTVSGATVATWTADLSAMLEAALNANSRLEDLVFLMGTARASTLQGLRDAASWAFRDEMREGRLLGVKTVVSPRIPAGKMMLVDGTRVLLGSSDTSLDVITDAPGYCEFDLGVIRAVLRADIRALSPANLIVLNG